MKKYLPIFLLSSFFLLFTAPGALAQTACDKITLNVAGNFAPENLERIRNSANCSGTIPIEIGLVPELANDPAGLAELQNTLRNLNFYPTWRLWGDGAPKTENEVNFWINVAKQINHGQIQLFNEPNLCSLGCFGSSSPTPEQDARTIEKFLNAGLRVPVGNAPLAHTGVNRNDVISHEEYWRRFHSACPNCIQRFDFITSNVYAFAELNRENPQQTVDEFIREWQREINFIESNLGVSLAGKRFVLAEAGLAPGSYGSNRGFDFERRKTDTLLFAQALEEHLGQNPELLARIDQIAFFLSDATGKQVFIFRVCDSTGCRWGLSENFLVGPGGGQTCGSGVTCLFVKAKEMFGDLIGIRGTARYTSGSGLSRPGLSGGTIRPKEGKIKVPNLTPEDEIFSNEETLSRLIPSNLLAEVSLPQNTLEGKVGVPGCPGDVIAETQGETEFEVPRTNSRLLGSSKIHCGIAGGCEAPESLRVEVVQPELPTVPGVRADGCPGAGQNPNQEAIEVAAIGQVSITSVSGIEKILSDIAQKAQSFFNRLRQLGQALVPYSEQIGADVQPVKYQPGEEELTEQVKNTFDAFTPASMQKPLEHQKEQTTYSVTAGESPEQSVGLEFYGVSTIKKQREEIFKRSLYPASMQP